jgi:hypothetical protein
MAALAINDPVTFGGEDDAAGFGAGLDAVRPGTPAFPRQRSALDRRGLVGLVDIPGPEGWEIGCSVSARVDCGKARPRVFERP